MKFKLLFVTVITVIPTCLSFMCWSFLFAFVHQISSTASLSLSELSSAAIGYLACRITYALLCLACFVCYCFTIILIMLLQF